MMPLPRRPPRPRRAAPRRRPFAARGRRLAGWGLAGWLWLVASGAPPAWGADPPAPPPPLPFGQAVTTGNCLLIAVLDYSDRYGELDNHDWVTVRVTNGCRAAVAQLEVRLLLLDRDGRAYGADLWLLGRGEALLPGQATTERYAIPDPDNRIAVAWRLGGIQARRLHPRRRKP